MMHLITKNNDDYIVGANRFTAEITQVDYSLPFDGLLRRANCQIYQNEVNGDMFWNGNGELGIQPQKFRAVKFTRWGVDEDLVRSLFANAGLRPATLLEALTFASTTTDRAEFGKSKAYVAFGSNTRLYNAQQFASLSWRQRKLPTWLGGVTTPNHQYPMLEDYDGYRWLLRLANSGGDWRPEVLFIGVHVSIPDRDNWLIPLEIDRFEYSELPLQDEITMTDQTVIGFRFRFHCGEIGEVVKFDNMPQHQCGALMSDGSPMIKFCRPVFV